jgi:hypothetical protein
MILPLQIFLGDVLDELLHARSDRQHLPEHRLGVLRHEQIGVVATDLLAKLISSALRLCFGPSGFSESF